MRINPTVIRNCLYCIMVFFLWMQPLSAQETELDKKVRNFLDSHKRQWRDMNVPATDGKILYDIITKNGYTRGLEIGTSTGHSAVWIAWAMSKTGGKLITIEIDEERYREALRNFEASGLTDYIDARLADAHKLVKDLEGPFDFVFSDADKTWYTNYFKDVDPKLVSGGCYTAHNIKPPGKRGMTGTKEFLDYVMSLDSYSTEVNTSGGGLSISFKRK